MTTTRSRHTPFYRAALAALLAGLSAFVASPLTAMIIAGNVFFVIYIAGAVRRLANFRGKAVPSQAARSDAPVGVIFVITAGVVASVVAALFVMLNARAAPQSWELFLALSAVPLGWITLHLMAAIHYAHVYWASESGSKPREGTSYPGTKTPGGADFAYFAFVIGMTAQTSDVEITSSNVRLVALVHGVVSFFFNTVLVAAAVNAAVTLSN